MTGRIVEIGCLGADPVPCPERFHAGSEGIAARRLLDHLDTVHVHDGGGPSWGLSWRDASGDQHIGVVHDEPASVSDPQRRNGESPPSDEAVQAALNAFDPSTVTGDLDEFSQDSIDRMRLALSAAMSAATSRNGE